MTFDKFKNKIQKYSKQIQNAIESDSNTDFIQILSDSEERKFHHGAHFTSKRFVGKGSASRTYVTEYYVTFSHTKFDGKNYLTIRKDFVDKTNKDLRVLFITDSGYSVSNIEFLRKNGYEFGGKKRFEKLLAIDFEKLTFIYHRDPKSEILWDSKYLAFFKYGETQYRGNFKVSFWKDKDLTEKIGYEATAGSAKSLYEKLVHETNFDMKLSTFQYHVGKAVDIDGVLQKVIKYRNPTTGNVLYILLTIENKKPNKNHRVEDDEFEEEIVNQLPEEIFKEAASCDSLDDAKTLLFWKYHIQYTDKGYFVKFKFKKKMRNDILV